MMRMKCVTKKEIKVKDFVIPARTVGTIINMRNQEFDCHSNDLLVMVDLLEFNLEEKTYAEIYPSDKNEERYWPKSTYLRAIVLSITSAEVYLDAEDYYKGRKIYNRQLQEVFDGNVPNDLKVDQTKPRILHEVIDYLENEFSDWVEKNCKWHSEETLEDEEEQNNFYMTDESQKRFDYKRRAYQDMLGKIGLIYKFTGGLVWEEIDY